MVDQLKSFLNDLKSLRRDVKTEKVTQISKQALRTRAENLGSQWFSDFSSPLSTKLGFSGEVLEKYSSYCAKLIKLSAPNNLKSSYLSALNGLIKSFRAELILPLQQGQPSQASSSFESFFTDIANSDESEYLKEAITCARSGLYRAAAVLGWCAAIDRIHHRVETVGFAKFNVTSAQMASQTKGRFKKFNQTQNVNSLSELRAVFDTTILWVVEGMSMIDSNQHTRLRSCFDMRCHGAHPGEAPITEFNLLSFFSDLDQIIFRHANFTL